MNNSLSNINNPIQIQQNNGLNNIEIQKNQELQVENQNLKNEIKKLNSQLQYYINENHNLKLNNNQMNINMQNNINNEINNLKKEIINLKNQLYLKDNEIKNLKNQINIKDNEIKNLKNNGKNVNINDILVIQFVSGDFKINKGIKCLSDETFAEAEERLYKIYDEYRNTNNMFLFNGNQILRFKKIRENKIHDGDQVQLVNHDSSMVQ